MFGKINEDGEYEGPTKLPSGMGDRGKIAGYCRKIPGKEFSDLLGPIENYLKSSVGRYWPKVYSELSANLGSGAWPVRHILEQHVNVAVDTYRGVDGEVWFNHKHGPRVVDGDYFTKFYVHPETKTLRYFQKKKNIYRKLESPIRKWSAGKDRWLVEVNGSWFLGTYTKEIRKYVPGTGPRDKIYSVTWPDYREQWEYDCFRFTRIKSASKKEIKAICGPRETRTN